MAYSYNPNAHEAESWGPWVWGQLRLHREFKLDLNYLETQFQKPLFKKLWQKKRRMDKLREARIQWKSIEVEALSWRYMPIPTSEGHRQGKKARSCFRTVFVFLWYQWVHTLDVLWFLWASQILERLACIQHTDHLISTASRPLDSALLPVPLCVSYFTTESSTGRIWKILMMGKI